MKRLKNNVLIYYVLLLLAMAGCKKGGVPGSSESRDAKENNAAHAQDGPESTGVKKPVALLEHSIVLDTGLMRKFLPTWRDKQEFARSIIKFYAAHQFHPAWFINGQPVPAAGKLVQRLGHSDEEGLNPGDFRVKELEEGLRKGKDAIPEVDVLLTTEFHRYAAQMLEGVTRRTRDEVGWFVPMPVVKYDTLLLIILADQGSDDPFKIMEPQHENYEGLKKALRMYRELDKKGGWPMLTGFTKLKPGAVNDNVIKLRERLARSGDLREGEANFYNPRVFDRALDLSVREFQTRHGLEPDGVVAGMTLQTMNISVKDRIRQVLVNLERWRMMPQNMGQTYLFVNVPEFRLHVMKEYKEEFNMRVIVGKEFQSTPVFADKLENLVFSPYWNIPKSIIAKEILPAVYRNPAFLGHNNMEAMYGFGKDAMQVPFWKVPWQYIGNDNFQYWIRQRPGGDNPLGLVKFLFPNNHNVYLHDTPGDHLFTRTRRDFSHGCIRIEQPERLAQFVLRDQPQWTPQTIRDAMNAGEERWLKVTPMPVYILYFTTWVDNSGKIQVRDDLYGLDEVQMRQLVAGENGTGTGKRDS